MRVSPIRPTRPGYRAGMRATSALLALGLTLAAALLTSCVPEPGPTGTGAAEDTTPTASASASASPTPSPTLIALPTDCRALLSAEVLAQLNGVPLNDPGFGTDAGVQPDGSLHCIWGKPDPETTRLQTDISYLNRGPALDMLNGLQQTQGFTCFTPDGGTRCEKTWTDALRPVTDGRTLFWRDGVLIDTRYSNLAPEGYTSAVVATLWP
jgi:hypothetical protein